MTQVGMGVQATSVQVGQEGLNPNAAKLAGNGQTFGPSRLFWLIFLTGMALRILFALLVPVFPVSDSAAYYTLARTMIDHGVYGWTADEPTAFWAVGTSALAAFTYLFTDSHVGVVILNLVAGGMIMGLTHQLCARWFGTRTAVIALCLVAVWPNLIFFTTILSSELFFIAMTLAGLFFWQRPVGNRWVNLLLCGLVWGLTCYIRPVILLVPVALALVDLAGGLRPFGRSVLDAVIAMLLISLVAAPWTLRNQRVFGEPVMISTNFGSNFWMGNNPQSTGGYMALPPEVASMSEIEREDYLLDEAKRFIRENPAEALKLLGKKFVRLNLRETIGVVWNEAKLHALVGEKGVMGAKLIATGYWYGLLLAAVAGMTMIGRRQGFVAAFFNPSVALWGYFTALHVVVVADDRYHMPASAFVAMLAAVAISRFSDRARGLV